jgi:hypothetical protein
VATWGIGKAGEFLNRRRRKKPNPPVFDRDYRESSRSPEQLLRDLLDPPKSTMSLIFSEYKRLAIILVGWFIYMQIAPKQEKMVLIKQPLKKDANFFERTKKTIKDTYQTVTDKIFKIERSSWLDFKFPPFPLPTMLKLFTNPYFVFFFLLIGAYFGLSWKGNKTPVEVLGDYAKSSLNVVTEMSSKYAADLKKVSSRLLDRKLDQANRNDVTLTETLRTTKEEKDQCQNSYFQQNTEYATLKERHNNLVMDMGRCIDFSEKVKPILNGARVTIGAEGTSPETKAVLTAIINDLPAPPSLRLPEIESGK